VSSTALRALIREGRVGLAKRLLARPYEIRGSIVKGARRGIQLGFPTANLKPDNELCPATGVYVTRAFVNGSELLGATNIGFRPTIQGFREPEPTIETHLLDFSGDLYGQSMKLQFCFRIRPERRFESVEALIQRIRKDILWVEKYSKKTSPVLSEGKDTRDQGRS
jgi:riboflavin kinase/FMN adenylyltransferase